mmetsp:Transcript_24087/g.50091  ORF Transcript_24087/g.50091 Transcript_24087/m.50091 type:complete len:208 (-) Transcript_24087:364-987(-)
MAPATAFPANTGMIFLNNTSPKVKGNFKSKAAGMRNMLATECSNPMATKVLMGNQTPTSLPARSLEAPDRKTAKLTIQLHMMALTKLCITVALHLPTAVLARRSAVPPVKQPTYQAAQAMIPHPTTFPIRETDQLRRSSYVSTSPSYLAAATVAEFPVNSCPPVVMMSKRLTGKRAAKAILTRPGLVAPIPAMFPATQRDSSPPNPT